MAGRANRRPDAPLRHLSGLARHHVPALAQARRGVRGPRARRPGSDRAGSPGERARDLAEGLSRLLRRRERRDLRWGLLAAGPARHRVCLLPAQRHPGPHTVLCQRFRRGRRAASLHRVRRSARLHARPRDRRPLLSALLGRRSRQREPQRPHVVGNGILDAVDPRRGARRLLPGAHRRLPRPRHVGVPDERRGLRPHRLQDRIRDRHGHQQPLGARRLREHVLCSIRTRDRRRADRPARGGVDLRRAGARRAPGPGPARSRSMRRRPLRPSSRLRTGRWSSRRSGVDRERSRACPRGCAVRPPAPRPSRGNPGSSSGRARGPGHGSPAGARTARADVLVSRSIGTSTSWRCSPTSRRHA